jgi:hypothetical protein
MKKSLIPVALMVALLCTVAMAGLEDRWLHVRVQEDGPDGERVSINIPLQLVEAILPTIETDELQDGKLRWDEADVEGIDLKEVLKAFQEAPDADFITVKGREESVRVAKEKGFLVIHADEDDEKVRVRMPLGVVDAMVDARGDELDLLAALEALADYDGDLVTVESEDSHVRIWIDSTNSGE